MWLSYGVGICSYYPAKKVKDHEPHMSEHLLDVIAKNPKVKHIASEMEESSVKKHRGKDREQGIDRLVLLKVQQVARNCTVFQRYVLLPKRRYKLPYICCDIEGYQPHCHKGENSGGIVILIGNQPALPFDEAGKEGK